MKQVSLTSKVRHYRNLKTLLFNFEGSAFKKRYGGIAQLGEHLLCKQGVCGSIPHISTIVRRHPEPKNNDRRGLSCAVAKNDGAD